MPECLRVFGRYWVRFAAKGSFKSIMDLTGDDIVQFVENLDRMHRAVVRTLPNAKMPSFKLIEENEGCLRILYRSERAGLDTFVVGLFEGLLDHFVLDGNVVLIGQGPKGLELLVNYAER